MFVFVEYEVISVLEMLNASLAYTVDIHKLVVIQHLHEEVSVVALWQRWNCYQSDELI